ncbi:hypothetical protein BDN67DRAFT_912337 [Paxillus ammoniavirescens]|nr:hypothetical protein BDN67DRAFT_912337 [Paxillus ammoniavirescens]
MVNCRISRDVKLAAIRLHERGLLCLQDILECCDFSERTFYRIVKLWCETGDVISQTQSTLRGRPRLLDHDDLDYLLSLVRSNPDYFLDKLISLVKTNRFISLHFTTIFRELERAGMSLKKLRHIAKERNEDLRAEFITRMSKYDPEQLGFVDETSKDERTVCRHYGRSQKGHQALLTLDGIIAATVVEGSMTQALFLDWLENSVVS